MLTKMRLENFKSWRELDLDLSNITILFGTNSSGKSSVLQSLLLLKQTAMGFDRKQPINLGGGETDFVDFGSYRDLVFGHSEKRRVGIKLDYLPAKDFMQENQIGIRKLIYSVNWQQLSERTVIDRLDYDATIADNRKFFFRMKRQGNDIYDIEMPKWANYYFGNPIAESYSTAQAPGNCYQVPYALLEFEDYSPVFETETLNHSFEGLMTQIAYLGPLRSYPQRNYLWRGQTPKEIGLKGERAIEVLLASQRDKSNLSKQVAAWLSQMELVSDFQITPVDKEKRYYEAVVKLGAGQPESSLLDVGFGISQVLPVIILLLSIPEFSIVLLEQPELHLHPCAQSNLADLLLEVAEKRNLQLIVESHSEHLLRRLQRRIAEAEQKFATPETIKLYFCELDNGESKLRPVQIDKYGQIANWPKDFFGDVSGDLDAMMDAALDRRRAELQQQ